MTWELANPYGILIDEPQDAWHAGHVQDVLPLASGPLVVAAETGGVWIVTPGTTATPGGDWEDPDVDCLALGPDGPVHVYAGCAGGTIYETDTGTSSSLVTWAPIAGGGPGAGRVRDLVVIPHLRILIAASE